MNSHPQRTGIQSSTRRHLVGLSGMGLLAVGIYFYIFPPTTGSVEFLQGSCVKSGLILVVTWLAFPQLDRLPVWLFVAIVGGLLAVAVRPRVVLAMMRYAVIFVPILVMIWFLRPKRRSRKSVSNAHSSPSSRKKVGRNQTGT